MDILHVSKVTDAVKGRYEVVFIYHSAEAKGALLYELDHKGFAWASGASLLRDEVIPTDLGAKGGLRVKKNEGVYWGSHDTYRDEAYKKFRVVL